MSGHHPFSELTKNFTAERRQRIDEKRMKLNAVMKIYETRQSVSTIRKVWEKWLRNTEKPSFESYPYRLIPMQGSRKQVSRVISYRKRNIEVGNLVNHPHLFTVFSKHSKPSDSSVTATTGAMYNTSFASVELNLIDGPYLTTP